MEKLMVACLLVLMNVIIGVTASEKPALKGFLKGLNPTPQELNSNWSNTVSTCNFKGVTCDNNSRTVQQLNLANSNLSGPILQGTLGNLTDLQNLNLAFNHLTGPIPSDIFTNCLNLTQLYLQSNSFNGSIPEFSNAHNLTIIDLSNNFLSGNIPGFLNISSTPNITTINLSNNNLSGNIPASLASLNLVQQLNLANSNLSGPILQGTLGNLTDLQNLNLAFNHFTGPIPSDIFTNCLNLTQLYLQSNSFNGSIPEFSNAHNLTIIDLSNNFLSGNIPGFLNISSTPNITTINLSNNNLSGNIPASLASLNLVQQLNLANSNLSGPILQGTLGNLPDLQNLNLAFNHLTGPIPSDIFTNCLNLTQLYLQSNSFNGSIPEFSNAHNLTIIDLSNNFLSGNIPGFLNISSTPKITTINLSNNNLSGNIPASLASLNLTTLVLLNLSYNSLSGEIPESLSVLDSAWFEGNPELCGPPLSKLCDSTSSKLSKLHVGLIVAASLILLAVLLCAFALLRRRSKPKTTMKIQTNNDGDLGQPRDEEGPSETAPSLVILRQKGGEKTRLDIDELLRGSAKVLGHGSFGNTYMAELEDGSTVVVKNMSKTMTVDRYEFESCLRSISQVEHPLLVPLLGYYCSNEQKFLLNEYFPLGSLYDALHGPSKEPLVWDRRLKVALDVALALNEIHTISEDKIHGDIRSSKIFFTGEGCMVSNMGLVALIEKETFVNMKKSYLAPEVIETCHLTQKSDVYSFGVLLMELITRKTPSNAMLDLDMELVSWVQSVTSMERTPKVFDNELQDEAQNHSIKEEIISLLRTSLDCVKFSIEDRPSMAQVYNMIINIRPSLVNPFQTNLQSST